MDSIHDGLLNLVKELDLPVHQIDASRSSGDTLSACAESFVEIAVERGIQLISRF
jgi:hypothetical protein